MSAPVRVLLLDMDEKVAAQGGEFFVNHNWQLDHARSLAEAIASAQKSVYMVVIIDIMLPDALGPEAWARLKNLQPHLWGIYTTSSPALYAAIDSTQQDIIAYFLKPLRWDKLCQFIAQAAAAVRA